MNNVAFLGAATILLVAAIIADRDNDSTSIRYPKVERSEKAINQDPPSVQMYKHIVAYADTFNIPLKYAFGIAYAETRYEGPLQWHYNPARESNAGALGPMQIMMSTARLSNKEVVSRHRLKTDIEYNVMTSMKLLRKLHNKYKNWKVVFGCYNTGRPIINGYAERVYNFKVNSQFY